MSHHHQSDPAFVRQFRRRWTTGSTAIKFLSELSSEELDRLALERGEAIIRSLPAAWIAVLTHRERRELAQAFGRPAIRRLRERNEAALFDPLRRSP